MSIPKYEEIMLPLLQYIESERECSVREIVDRLAGHFKLTEEEQRELLPSGQQPIFENRVGWARTYLKKAGLLESPRRGFLRITDRGRVVLERKPDRIDCDFLMQFPEFQEFRVRRTPQRGEDKLEGKEAATPEEQLAHAYEQLKQNLVGELLEQIRKCSPTFFEKLVVRLLVAMGYGGTFADAAKAVGGSHDEGIDGIIKEDRLGFDVVYIQAKRWDGAVGRPEIQKFVGALKGHRARKGVFITTSTFTKEAEDYVSRLDDKIVLIDGQRLAELMIEHDCGVSTAMTYRLKKVDADFFGEE
ncbi:MAG: restriction endonuclease [Pseudomonadota bacterium]